MHQGHDVHDDNDEVHKLMGPRLEQTSLSGRGLEYISRGTTEQSLQEDNRSEDHQRAEGTCTTIEE